jgi:hypothetical protein
MTFDTKALSAGTEPHMIAIFSSSPDHRAMLTPVTRFNEIC